MSHLLQAFDFFVSCAAVDDISTTSSTMHRPSAIDELLVVKRKTDVQIANKMTDENNIQYHSSSESRGVRRTECQLPAHKSILMSVESCPRLVDTSQHCSPTT